jgi:hypothetical protein
MVLDLRGAAMSKHNNDAYTRPVEPADREEPEVPTFAPDPSGSSVASPHHQATVSLDEQARAALAEPPVVVPGYTILRELGRGGMGVVYQARQTKLQRIVALKMILGGEQASASALRRFRTDSADRTARLWDVATGEPVTPPLVHPRALFSVALSPDRKLILTGCDGGRTQLWDAATGKAIGPSLALGRNAGFAPDGATYLASNGATTVCGLKVPARLEGDTERLVLWAQVLTGLEMDAKGTIGVLDGVKWNERRQRLEKLGGPPP